MRWLCVEILKLWSTGVFPPDWSSGLVTSNYTGRGDRKDWYSYRGITLLSVPGEVFACLILNRIRDHLVLTQHLEPDSFTSKRSTIDCNLGLRVLMECRIES